MKTLHSGKSDFPFTITEMIAFDWKLEDAEDHEHPYILTVTVAGHSHSEGYPQAIGEDEAAANAEKLAREVYSSAQGQS